MNNPIAIIAICVIVAFIVFNFIRQTNRLNRSKLGKVMAIYKNVRYNERLLKKFGYKGSADARFRTDAWDAFKPDIDFLPADRTEELNKLFDQVHRINNEIGSSIENRGETALYGVNVDTLQDPLLNTRKYLDHWIRVNYDNPKVAPKRPGFFGF